MSEDKIIFSMAGLSKVYPPQKKVLKNIYLSFFYGAKIGVLGLNGSGKSSLLKIIAGLDDQFQGEVVFSPGYSVGMLEQEPKMDSELTVIDVIKEGVKEVTDLLEEYDQINLRFGEPEILDNPDKMEQLIEQQGKVQEQLDQVGAWDLDNKLDRAMDALRTPPEDALIKNLSGGEKRRVALCRLLLQEPDVLLLDEPTNHLDAESVLWLEHHLQQYEGTVIAVTHDRYFLDNVAGWILELDRGAGIPWKGNYSSWLDQKQKRLAQEDKSASKRQKTLERELEWVRMAPKARQAKSKARLGAYEKLLGEDANQKEATLELFIPPGPRLGSNVIDVEGVSKSYGDKLLFDDLHFSLPQGGIVGVIGPNGAGKSTLFKLITGKETPDAGSFKVGSTVVLSYVDQEHDQLKSEETVFDAISGGNEFINLGGKEMNARAYTSRFNFSGTDQQKKVGDLSGGERNRVHLAMTLKQGANLILLDEPTNDLDINTLRALEEGLENFGGCAVVISHDRWFLDRIATHILAFEGDSQVSWFEGNFSDYEENRKKRLGDLAPKRIKFKKLK
ncbi:energy-dependent translational throttle protein EttA [Cyclobacteriaceae bacterium]|jgi:sulfate-transporting ATPase|nr:energy-dependent translational throttle protein EttA [Cyclobacteriaceae bacterium]MDB4314817.1 energy-dependent translational throttle protein EttA [Cyclobacteriaceae bacterium]|tara:strand:- start:148 stop:1827 length:1680 start_codon:yes stop_codon:yes gene_type:complete